MNMGIENINLVTKKSCYTLKFKHDEMIETQNNQHAFCTYGYHHIRTLPDRVLDNIIDHLI